MPEPKIADAPLAACNTLWIGGPLTGLATACLASFVETGHAVRLYVYEPVDGVPAGVVLADAARIVPPDRARPYLASRSFASFSNLFRYELLAREPGGVWIDCDLLSVRPLMAGPAHLFGYEATNRINNAVLKLPPDSPVLADLRAVFTTAGWRPPWNDWKRNLRDHVRRALGRDYSAVVTGPRVLSYFVEKHRLADLTSAIDVFYPVAVHATPNLLRPDFDIQPLITPRTLCIHLCTSYLGDRLDGGAPAGSFLAAVLDGNWRAHLPAANWKIEGRRP